MIIGLSFERPYLMEGLNLMIPTLARNRSFEAKKTAVFGLKSGETIK